MNYFYKKYNYLSQKYDFNLNLTLLSIVIPIVFLSFLKGIMFIGYKLDADFDLKEKDLLMINCPITYDNYTWNCGRGGKGRIIKTENYRSYFYIPCFMRDFQEQNINSHLNEILAFKNSNNFQICVDKSFNENRNSSKSLIIYELKLDNNPIYTLSDFKNELYNRYQLNWFWYSIAIIIFVVLNYYAFKQY
jgi:hypothetical protein